VIGGVVATGVGVVDLVAAVEDAGVVLPVLEGVTGVAAVVFGAAADWGGVWTVVVVGLLVAAASSSGGT
jgi:hypothetical protein